MIKVYHIKNFRDAWDASTSDTGKVSMDDYRLAATVETDNPSKAFELTNNIWHSWTENEGVVCHTDEPRSTSAGDLMEVDGKLLLLKPCGFQEVTVN